jgi:hypothetical protein
MLIADMRNKDEKSQTNTLDKEDSDREGERRALTSDISTVKFKDDKMTVWTKCCSLVQTNFLFILLRKQYFNFQANSTLVQIN